ncbi:unknown [Megamonas funiformis CAG:377]|nr:unknown [Megamonas funiformis CAG:377]
MALSIIETPTTPPSIILLGIKNISNPIAVIIEPIKI